MKLTTSFLVLCVALLSQLGDAFFVESLVKPVAEPIAALAPAAGAVPSLPRPFNPLKLMLASLGIPVEHLIDGSRKCVAELGPEAVGAVKTLLVTATPLPPSPLGVPPRQSQPQAGRPFLLIPPLVEAQGLWL
ncbi:secretoglobin family 3A member 1 isoform X1 [Fukomys damarensis]|uniref:secretoglobin family 3A member 1 isoform X1 n=1 Tax=Fukomys damarensis TaxID=885580 RepID=UPI001455320B|nr:secretoglobin family 3A member 1 isoform X1 [Fukomys damarensis]